MKRKAQSVQASSTASYRHVHIIKSDDTGNTETVNYLLLDISDSEEWKTTFFFSANIFSLSNIIRPYGKSATAHTSLCPIYHLWLQQYQHETAACEPVCSMDHQNLFAKRPIKTKHHFTR